jgi:uncharacterized membrane protein YccC
MTADIKGEGEASWITDGLLGRILLQPDISRAARVTTAFMVPLAFCFLVGLPRAAPFVATAAQVVAFPNLRGDYGVRVVILVAMIGAIAAAGFLGTMVGPNIGGSILIMGAIALFAGIWRHLSPEYGPSFGIFSALLFLMTLEIGPEGPRPGQIGAWIVCGGLFAMLLQAGSWVFRPQHALRKAVAESWVVASDVFLALKKQIANPSSSEFAEKERDLRAVIDKGAEALAAKSKTHATEFLIHLEAIHLLSPRLPTRMIALVTSLEQGTGGSEGGMHLPELDALLNTLANTARSVAIAIVTHRRQNLEMTQVRLRRCEHLFSVLEDRLTKMAAARPPIVHAIALLHQASEFLEPIKAALEDTVDSSESRWMFPIRFPDLSGYSMKMVASGLNPVSEMDSVLIRYSLRMAFLTTLAVAVYKYFAIPRGYWMAFTIIVVLQPDFGATRQKAAQRILGTLGGVLLGTALLWLKMSFWLLDLVAGAAMFGFVFFVVRRYALAVLFVTVMLVLVTEMRTPVHLDFAVGRLLSNAVGGLSALLAAFIFWPSWEREKFPCLMAQSLRANRDYLMAVASRAVAGQAFAAEAVELKRRAERQGAIALASFQRLLGEPKKQRLGLERSSALAAYNQRITRAITVFAAQLRERSERFDLLESPVLDISRALDDLAASIESGNVETMTLHGIHELLRTADLKLADASAQLPHAGPAGHSALMLAQVARFSTEIRAMLVAMDAPQASTF